MEDICKFGKLIASLLEIRQERGRWLTTVCSQSGRRTVCCQKKEQKTCKIAPTKIGKTQRPQKVNQDVAGGGTTLYQKSRIVPEQYPWEVHKI